jgi:hypothetical protein
VSFFGVLFLAAIGISVAIFLGSQSCHVALGHWTVVIALIGIALMAGRR